MKNYLEDDGVQVWWYDNGQIKEIKTSGNKAKGFWQRWHENGQTDIIFRGDTYIRYYDTGQIANKGNYTKYSDRTGKWEAFFEDGSVKSISHFKDGKLHGYREVRNAAGDITYKGSYKNGYEDSVDGRGAKVIIETLTGVYG